MLATIPATHGGGDHGHIGLIFEHPNYAAFSTGSTPFTVPQKTGPFPMNISPNKVDQLHQIAENKQEMIKYKTYQGCLQVARTKIIQAINPEWLAGLCSELLRFTYQTPKEMPDQLDTKGVILNDVDIQELHQHNGCHQESHQESGNQIQTQQQNRTTTQ